jgi:hypothetical protein
LSRKRQRNARRVEADRPAAPSPSGLDDAAGRARVRERFALFAARVALGRLFRLPAVFLIAVSGFLLILAWQSAPQRLLEAHRYARHTASAEGRIVASWVALNWRPDDMASDHLRWYAYANAEPCVVVEFEAGGRWGAERRAFCGNRMPFFEHDTLDALRTMAPGVPFGWQRDARGIAVQELRVSAAGREWLATHAPYSTTFLGKPEPATALAALDRQLNRPVDAVVASYAAPPPKFPVAFDPEDPLTAMPSAWVESRRHFEAANWAVLILFGGIGLAIWFGGMGMLLGNIPPRARFMLSCVPLVTLPWWSERFPDALRTVSKDIAGIAGDMIGGIDRTGRVIGAPPEDATLARSERLVLPVGREPYAATFGRLALPPLPRLTVDANAGLLALTTATTEVMRALPRADQRQVLAQLLSDKRNDLKGAGLAFVPYARETLLDGNADAELRLAARRFLAEWVVQPIVEPHRSDPDFEARLHLYTELADVPIPEIRIMAKSVADRARESR